MESQLQTAEAVAELVAESSEDLGKFLPLDIVFRELE
jgi:hypothetical protein